jgi:hypothetical protein
MNPLFKIIARMTIFFIVGLTGTFIVNKGSIIWGRVATTVAIFLVMNIIFEIWKKFHGGKLNRYKSRDF